MKNISKYGDTDIFPYPIEKNIFFDLEDKTLALLNELHSNFSTFLSSYPPVNQSSLCPVGYTGFRWGTQIDPIWNLYFLSLVIEISPEIEKARIPVTQETIFSYRFHVDATTNKLFNDSIGWNNFQRKTLEVCELEKNKFILIADISDFYSRIYHHRLENALKKLSINPECISRIMSLLQRFSGNKSYGLPVGGNAARILSELVLNNTDKLLRMKGIQFCRYADDYHIFASSMEEAYQQLITLSELLLKNEGLALQKNKTRIMPVDEFKKNSEVYELIDAKNQSPQSQFLKINLVYDPYSATANEDYEYLKEQVNRFDILGMLKTELSSKSRIHKHLVSILLKAINHLNDDIKAEAVFTLLQNLPLLAPVFSQVMQVISSVFESLDSHSQYEVHNILRKLILKEDYLVRVDLNLHFAVLLIGKMQSEENEYLLNKVFENTESELVKKDIILIFAKWNSSHWIGNLRIGYNSLNVWEKRSFIVSSYVLEDEGKHWRDHLKKDFSPIELLYRDWGALKKQTTGLGHLI